MVKIRKDFEGGDCMGDYQGLMTDLVKKQMVMLGPGVAISTARKVSALTVADDGQVTAIASDPQSALSQLVQQYMNLSGQIAQATLTSLLEKYPDIQKPSSG